MKQSNLFSRNWYKSDIACTSAYNVARLKFSFLSITTNTTNTTNIIRLQLILRNCQLKKEKDAKLLLYTSLGIITVDIGNENYAIPLPWPRLNPNFRKISTITSL